jgi:hypothetical protein
MTANSLEIITQITVEIHKDNDSMEKLGSGVLYANRKLSGLVYVLTAKHCLAKLTENGKVSLRVFNQERNTYEYLTPVKQTILLHPDDDAGIVVFSHRELCTVCPNLPSVFVIDKNVGFDEAVTKGFPMATLDQTSEQGESSLVTLQMRYLQEITSEQAFQLSTLDDYTEDNIKGMSGAGFFIEACEELYLNGIFTRFTDEEKGKVIYSQRLTSFNELLEIEYKRKMPLAFLGHHGLGHKTFKNNVDDSVANLGPRYWAIRYEEVKSFIETNHRNPSKYEEEERRMLHFLKRGRKLINAGQMQSPRLGMFKELMELNEKYKRKNQYE